MIDSTFQAKLNCYLCIYVTYLPVLHVSHEDNRMWRIMLGEKLMEITTCSTQYDTMALDQTSINCQCDINKLLWQKLITTCRLQMSLVASPVDNVMWEHLQNISHYSSVSWLLGGLMPRLHILNYFFKASLYRICCLEWTGKISSSVFPRFYEPILNLISLFTVTNNNR